MNTEVGSIGIETEIVDILEDVVSMYIEADDGVVEEFTATATIGGYPRNDLPALVVDLCKTIPFKLGSCK